MNSNNRQIKAQLELPVTIQKLLDEKNKESLKDRNHPIYKEIYEVLYEEIGMYIIKPLENNEK